MITWDEWWFINKGLVIQFYEKRNWRLLKLLVEELAKKAWDYQQEKIDLLEKRLKEYEKAEAPLSKTDL